jgi:branched-chain amino acid transport system ATP-binding protein
VLHNLRISRSSQIQYNLLDSFFMTNRMQEEERAMAKAAMDLLALFGLTDFAHERPPNLPYGVQRRVEICRALVMKPRLLLLDEPAAGMNPGEITALMDLIRWVKKEFAVTLDHRTSDGIMGICDRISGSTLGTIARNAGKIKPITRHRGLFDEVGNALSGIGRLYGAIQHAWYLFRC